ncbi:hypothetical protein Taro_022228 [Colocasia esculenta]|uniref:DYW domain-containing protein n=1 Tax=Colocasia esculenta TaxID=4460 RepID=A0A843V4R2_COLES|nr:hypothetical protein [Colocasia esculenta]
MAQLDAALQRCTAFSHIKQFHAHLLTSGLFQTCPFARTKLVDLCAVSSFGNLGHALAMFAQTRRPTTNDWNAAIRGLAQGEDPVAAVSVFTNMVRLGGRARPDALTCSFALRACARANALREATQLHSRVVRCGLAADFRLQTTIVDAYAKGGDLDAAEKMFDEMDVRDVPTWNALINGFAAGSRPHDALALFRRMHACFMCVPDVVTVLGALAACAQLGDIAEGEEVRAYAKESGLETHVRVRNALMDMYSKCGEVDRAVEVFRGTPATVRSLVSWNTVIMALALHGHGLRALHLFEGMINSRSARPDAVTYLAVLSGCNHAGLVEDGLRVFHSMRQEMVPFNVKHYGCVVDMLGRAGRLHEAYDMVTTMPLPPDVVLWQTLLGACKTHGDIALAEHVSQKLFDMESHGDGDYVLLSNVYAAAERWADVGRVRTAMAERDVRKVPGFSYIRVGGAAHRFLNGGLGEHPQWQEIQRTLDEMRTRVGALGHAAETAGNVLHDVLEEDKEEALWQHSERLAVALGLLVEAAGEGVGKAITVVKNLRICGDCHAVAKLVSRAYGRAVVVRDRARFHRFEGGKCSCGDYW